MISFDERDLIVEEMAKEASKCFNVDGEDQVHLALRIQAVRTVTRMLCAPFQSHGETEYKALIDLCTKIEGLQ